MVRGVVFSRSSATQQISFPRWETLVGLTVGCDVVGAEVGWEDGNTPCANPLVPWGPNGRCFFTVFDDNGGKGTTLLPAMSATDSRKRVTLREIMTMIFIF